MLNLSFNPFPFLTTERLVLRSLVMEDAPEIFIQRSDPEILKYIKRTPAKDLAEAEEWIGKIIGAQSRDESILWAMVPKGSTRLIGTICYWNIEPEKDKAELGYSLHHAYFKKGLMGEALSRVVSFGFETMNLRRIDAYTNKNNEPSLNLLKRNGFKRNIPFENEHVEKEEREYNVVYTLNRT
jgi:ribosomal-protein-alanine N-acetyltransferase